ncbi:MAG: Ryanodine receptor Ryr [Acidobacteria bacterium]|nr:Ryanodine receptor Ryr [Acidobacteriota bacterium]MBV9623399.1 Ryanodine receptor Ryr [Acidobacteriota bacterium]
MNTSAVVVDEQIVALIEKLARNNHEVWAARRLAEGWRYGPRRDDTRKEHPGLVPYSDLSEGEKAYDRSTVVETIRAILAMGYRIERV